MIIANVGAANSDQVAAEVDRAADALNEVKEAAIGFGKNSLKKAPLALFPCALPCVNISEYQK